MDTKGLQKEFINWCKSKNKQPKSEDETKQLFVAFMKEKHPEEYKQAMENQQKQQQAQTQKALHGAKLNYFKSLKNQCAEDEEVVYYKKGGSVTCGCKKKEQGGEVKKDCGGSAIAKFKKMKSGKKITIKQQPLVNPNDTVHVNGIAYSVTNSDGSPVDKRFKPYSGKVEEEDRKKAKKGDKDAQKRQLKQDLASSEKCGGKVKKHQEGSVISKFKAYRKGGSLNGIPFMQAGTPKGGIEYNPTEIYNPMVHGVIGPTSYDPMIHGVVGPKETPQQKVAQYRVAQYKQKYPKATEQTNGQKVMQRGKELLGNITALTRVPTNAIKNWWNSTPSKNLNQIAYTNRNTNSWDLGQRYLGLKKGGIL